MPAIALQHFAPHFTVALTIKALELELGVALTAALRLFDEIGQTLHVIYERISLFARFGRLHFFKQLDEGRLSSHLHSSQVVCQMACELLQALKDVSHVSRIRPKAQKNLSFLKLGEFGAFSDFGNELATLSRMDRLMEVVGLKLRFMVVRPCFLKRVGAQDV